LGQRSMANETTSHLEGAKLVGEGGGLASVFSSLCYLNTSTGAPDWIAALMY
jgi:hypothetical protein